MAFDKTPSSHLTGWTENGTDITVPIATFTELTAAEADASTGDIRKIVFAVVEKFYQLIQAMDAEDRPAKLRITRDTVLNESLGTMARRYTIDVDGTFTNLTGQEVADEA